MPKILSKGLRSILFGRLAARMNQREAGTILAALQASQGAAPKIQTPSQRAKQAESPSQADPVREALFSLTPEQVQALPPELAQGLLRKYAPQAAASGRPSVSPASPRQQQPE